jgi:hypothetical protein
MMHLLTDEYFIDEAMARAECKRILGHRGPLLAELVHAQGELASALMDARDARSSSWKYVWDAAARVAALSMLIATEGDEIAKPNHVNTRDMCSSS